MSMPRKLPMVDVDLAMGLELARFFRARHPAPLAGAALLAVCLLPVCASDACFCCMCIQKKGLRWRAALAAAHVRGDAAARSAPTRRGGCHVAFG